MSFVRVPLIWWFKGKTKRNKRNLTNVRGALKNDEPPPIPSSDSERQALGGSLKGDDYCSELIPAGGEVPEELIRQTF